MFQTDAAKRLATLLLVLGLGLPQVGCTLFHRNKYLEQTIPPDAGIPRELAKTTLPVYRIEAPDILLIDAVKVIPREPYNIEPLDILQILVSGTLEGEPPIMGEYRVESSGIVALGPSYGTVKVAGSTLEQATKDVQEHLEKILASPGVSISLAEPAAQQQIAGEHLVGPDGTVNLGIYGAVIVSGMTLRQARSAIEQHLAQFLQEPEVSVDVAAYNSKVYYVVTQGAGEGDQIIRVPITGNETVLDAISQLGGFTQVSSKCMWVARPAPPGQCKDLILPVDWNAIVQGGRTETNFQLLPGDRLFVAEDKMVLTDNFVQKATGPFERIFGFLLLGTQTIQTINRSPTGFNVGNNSINPFLTGT